MVQKETGSIRPEIFEYNALDLLRESKEQFSEKVKEVSKKIQDYGMELTKLECTAAVYISKNNLDVVDNILDEFITDIADLAWQYEAAYTYRDHYKETIYKIKASISLYESGVKDILSYSETPDILEYKQFTNSFARERILNKIKDMAESVKAYTFANL